METEERKYLEERLFQAVKEFRHLADREHDYVATRTSYYLLAESILLLGFATILTRTGDGNIPAEILVVIAGMMVSLFWFFVGWDHDSSLKVARGRYNSTFCFSAGLLHSVVFFLHLSTGGLYKGNRGDNRILCTLPGY